MASPRIGIASAIIPLVVTVYLLTGITCAFGYFGYSWLTIGFGVLTGIAYIALLLCCGGVVIDPFAELEE